MKHSRICIFLFLPAITLNFVTKAQGYNSLPINRFELVNKYNLKYTNADSSKVMTVGNGEMAFSVDVTGLQTFPANYANAMPLTTMSNWGWHSFPNPKNYQLADVLMPVNIRGKTELYPTIGFPHESDNTASNWLNENPHHFNLGLLGFILLKSNGAEASIWDIKKVKQILNLWEGTIYSTFEFDGYMVKVITNIDPRQNQIAVAIHSALIKQGRLKIKIRFPYGSNTFTGADWESPEKHQTAIIKKTATRVDFKRSMDSVKYYVSVGSNQHIKVHAIQKHNFEIEPEVMTDHFSISCIFSPSLSTRPLINAVIIQNKARKYWEKFWTKGGIIDFSGSTDPRAAELERRVILSQYFTAIQSSGSLPPQESGLMNNTWNGKFHLEVHWFHAAHFALWGHTEMLEKSLQWYIHFLPKARKLAKEHGYKGARWPKMIGPDGRESPNHINPFIIWQQPHIIYLSELCYRSKPETAVLQKYKDLVLQTAEFLASYLTFDTISGHFILGPPVMPPPEILRYGFDSSKNNFNYVIWPANETYNPSFELAYWDFGLRTAQKWLERLGMPRNKEWDLILNHLSPLPKVKDPVGNDSLYLHAENSKELWIDRKLQIQHPSFLMAKGFLPGNTTRDRDMLVTLNRVMDTWDNSIWGTDFPMIAMTAARLNQPATAINALFFKSSNNTYSSMGMNMNWNSYPVYLPSNGFLLSTIALMAAGWDGNKVPLPGFPKDGKWKVRFEGISKLP